jgi:hypothetical protein
MLDGFSHTQHPPPIYIAGRRGLLGSALDYSNYELKRRHVDGEPIRLSIQGGGRTR